MKHNFAIYILISAVLVAAVTACRQPANTNVNASNEVRSAAATPTNGDNNPARVVPPAPPVPPVGVASPTPTTALPVADSATTGSDKTPRQSAAPRAAKIPQPQIGSGGNDFFLFTQTRAALNADEELKKSALTVAVHNGVVTLSGTVQSDGLKQQAARLAQGVQGIKSVKNELRVAAGGAK